MLNCRWIRIIFRMLYEMVFVSLLLYSFTILFLNEMPGFFVIFTMCLLYIVSFGIREWAPTQIILLFLHLILIGVLLVLPFPGRMGMVLISVQVYLTIAALIYVHKGAVIKPIADIPWPSFLICSLIYVLSMVSHQPALMSITYIITILLLILYYGMLYVEGLTKYVDSTKDASGLPLKRMVHTNTKIIGIIILILLFGLIAGRIFGTKETTDALLAVCGTIVRCLFWIIGFLLSKLREVMGVQDMELYYADGDLTIPEEVTGWGLILEILLLAVFVAVMVLLFYRLLRRLIKLLLKPRSYGEDVVEAAEKDKGVTKEKNRGKISFSRSLTLEEKARKYYRLRILKHKDTLILNDQTTCRDIQSEIEQKRLDDVQELTELYTEIRYGIREVDKKTLKKIRELARNKKSS